MYVLLEVVQVLMFLKTQTLLPFTSYGMFMSTVFLE